MADQPIFRALLVIAPDRVPKGTRYRLRVEINRDGWGTEIAEEEVTSFNDNAQVLDGKTIDLLDDELDWLYARLGEAIEARRRERERQRGDGSPQP